MAITLTRSATSREAELAAIKARASAHVNGIIGQRRLEFITDRPGQEMIYREKAGEAARYMAERPADLEEYPFLVAEIGITAPDAEALARLWLARARSWKVIGGQLEAIRQGALIAIAAATVPAGVDVALSEFDTVCAAWAPPV
ncbi:hypothetical protein [Roseicyclus sp.]|uniref:hypothetical protein n=1 Tax=Roseicyclus sp. TaxID=1914329 RepID=UPI003F6AC7A5